MNNKKTFHEVSEIWCDAKRPIVKHSTLCAYQLTLQTHLLPRFGAAENITEKDVQHSSSISISMKGVRADTWYSGVTTVL